MPSPGRHNDMLFELIQNVSNQVLELAKNQSSLDSCVSSIKKQIDAVLLKQDEIIRQVQGKMSPDRCGLMHDDVKNQIAKEMSNMINPSCKNNHEKLKKEMFKEMKDGAKGWVNTTVLILRIIMYLGLGSGGAALAADYGSKLIGS